MLRKYVPRWLYIFCLFGAWAAASLRFGIDVGFFTLAFFIWFEPRDPQ